MVGSHLQAPNLFHCPPGEMGRRLCFKSRCRKACRFESDDGHQSFETHWLCDSSAGRAPDSYSGGRRFE